MQKKNIPISFMDSDEEILNMMPSMQLSRGILNMAHIADIHFTAFNPKIQYQILKEQFVSVIEKINLDLIAIDGDLFDHKIMSNSEGAMYANLFIGELVSYCRNHSATLILIHGTSSHDADQLKMFYHYTNDDTVDVRVVTAIQFEYVRGARVLCIPELYGIDESIYQKYLYRSGIYDMCFMHGTIKGAVPMDAVGNGRLFTIGDFCKCRGPIFSGHVHSPGCFNKYFYYTGTPFRYKHGEEHPKGFILSSYNMDTYYHYSHFVEVTSFVYRTINVDNIIDEDPRKVIEFINRLKSEQGIDNLKIRFDAQVAPYNKTVLNNYFRNISDVSIEYMDTMIELQKKAEDQLNEMDQYGFIFDDGMSDLDKFVAYCNHEEGHAFITVDKLIEILEEEV